MIKINSIMFAITLASLSATAADNVSDVNNFFSNDGISATEDNYPTLETSRQILKNQSLVGINQFLHKRELTPTDMQPVVRMNRDTYYSFAVVDVSEGASITLPEIDDGRYMSVQGVTEDHRIQAMQYGSGSFNLRTHTGNHLYLVIRLDSNFTEEEAKRIQNSMIIDAKSNSDFKSVQVNKESFYKIENSLKAKTPELMKRDGGRTTYGMFTDPTDSSKELFTKEKYAVGAALGWGGAQLEDNIYEISRNFPADKCHQATFKDPQNGAFWSFTVYDAEGFMFNDLANVSTSTATPNEDGTYTISFGCDENTINNIPTKNNTGVFNLAVRHYLPSNQVKDGYRLVPFVKEK